MKRVAREPLTADRRRKRERSHCGENPKMAGVGALEAELREEGVANPEEEAEQEGRGCGLRPT